jgi:5-methylcytosine-specific restriction endonuclease McrA
MILRYRVTQFEKMPRDIIPRLLLESIPVLMLSTGYEPLFQTNWKRAVSAIVKGRAEVVEIHEELTIGTVTGNIPFPTKVRYTSGILIGKIRHITRGVKLSRKSLFLRDKGLCQYCDKKLVLKSCTIDHVVPKSRGGGHDWNNVVLCCTKCNQRKGSSLLGSTGMILRKVPCEPSLLDILVDF